MNYYTVKFISYNEIAEMETEFKYIYKANSRKQVLEYMLDKSLITLETQLTIEEIISEDLTDFSGDLIYSFDSSLGIRIRSIKLHQNKIKEYKYKTAINDIRKKLTESEIKLLGL